MLNQTEAVIFDLDGTLMDSMWMWTEIDVEFLGRYGYELPPDLQKSIEGMGFRATAEYIKERFAIPHSIDEIIEIWNQMSYDKYAKEVPLKPGAGGFLRYLREKNIPMGIASSNNHKLIGACLRGNGIEGWFSCITTSCDVAKSKPAPDVYLSVAASLGVKPEHCLVFEDVPMGILAGKNAGMKVCAVEDRFSIDQKDRIRELADYYIRSYDQVLDGTYERLKKVNPR